MCIRDRNYLTFKRRFKIVTQAFFDHFFKGAAITKSDLSHQKKSDLNPFVDKVKVADGGYTVALTENNKAYSAQSLHFASEAQAHQFMKSQVAAQPELHETLHVIPSYEVAA